MFFRHVVIELYFSYWVVCHHFSIIFNSRTSSNSISIISLRAISFSYPIGGAEYCGGWNPPPPPPNCCSLPYPSIFLAAPAAGAFELLKIAFSAMSASARTAALGWSPLVGCGVPRYWRHCFTTSARFCMDRLNSGLPCSHTCLMIFRHLRTSMRRHSYRLAFVTLILCKRVLLWLHERTRIEFWIGNVVSHEINAFFYILMRSWKNTSSRWWKSFGFFDHKRQSRIHEQVCFSGINPLVRRRLDFHWIIPFLQNSR